MDEDHPGSGDGDDSQSMRRLTVFALASRPATLVRIASPAWRLKERMLPYDW
ncbi:MAG: hypothetical protein L3J77_03355 [Thermoplasmata archaeon]|nr:hypothetical protein [Thermoplasmata archaeon]